MIDFMNIFNKIWLNINTGNLFGKLFIKNITIYLVSSLVIVTDAILINGFTIHFSKNIVYLNVLNCIGFVPKILYKNYT